MPQQNDDTMTNDTPFNQTVFEKIPTVAGNILEIGCHRGSLANAVKSKLNHPCFYQGIEIDLDSSQEARKYLDVVYHTDAEEFDFHQIQKPIDCLLFADSLEHMKNPGKLLNKILPFVIEKGTIIICIPNVGHLYLIDSLLRGQWNYTQSGLLDRTHYHFFTLESFLRLSKNLNLVVKEITPIVHDSNWFTKITHPYTVDRDFKIRLDKILELIRKGQSATHLIEKWYPGYPINEAKVAQLVTVQYVFVLHKSES